MSDGDKMPGAQWCKGAILNFAENPLKGRREVSFAELFTQVVQLASALKQRGVAKDDRVAGWLPNSLEAIVGMLATSSLGTVVSSCSPDFGLQGVLDRFGQIEPKVLLAVDGYCYNGKP